MEKNNKKEGEGWGGGGDAMLEGFINTASMVFGPVEGWIFALVC